MKLKEIKARADFIRKDLPLGIWMTQTQLCWLTGIDGVRFWRLPADEKPAMLRMAGAEMIQIDAAVRWAEDFWQRQEAKKVTPR